MVHFSSADAEGKAFLFIWFEGDMIRARLKELAHQAGFSPLLETAPGVLTCLVEDLSNLPELVAKQFSLIEQRSLRVLLSVDEAPSLTSFGEILSLEHFCQQLSSRWLTELLDNRRVRSLMQPIVTASGESRVMGYEFLLRGINRDGEDIPAPLMFKAGSDMGLLAKLDHAAGEMAAKTAHYYEIEGLIFINLLPSTLADEAGFDDWLKAVAMDGRLPLDRLVLELVESEHFADVDALCRLRARLAGLGVRFALDDFGNGFNNLSTLTSVRPDYIKLDKSLQAGLTSDARKWHMVANIVDSAKQVDVRVIAEGVEDEETAQALRAVGVDYLQGYLYGYPKEGPVGLGD